MATLPQPAPYDEQAKLKEMDSVPLFMRDLPKDSEEQSEALEALQALVYDGTPDEIATNFKDQGNDYFKSKRYREALGFYNQALDAKTTEKALLESLHLNRAACNLELQNYGSVLRDCSKVLATNPSSLKAFYRSALALIALERSTEAIDCCNRALGIERENPGILSALKKAKDLKDRQDRKEQVRLHKIATEEAEKRRLGSALKERNLFIVPNTVNDIPGEQKPRLSKDDPPILHLPVIFLYPQYTQSDIISSFEEHTKFTDHLEVMFPPNGARPGWDIKEEYDVSNLALYASTKKKRLLKIGKKTTLAELCRNAAAKPGEPVDYLELAGAHLAIIVLPKGDVEQKWIEDFKRERG
ncbi:hypothetical protein FRC19_007258 [Serendipita sp. 401]|nr:hypothetical protein FRC19_007258 [Serendipita sp. 401]